MLKVALEKTQAVMDAYCAGITTRITTKSALYFSKFPQAMVSFKQDALIFFKSTTINKVLVFTKI